MNVMMFLNVQMLLYSYFCVSFSLRLVNFYFNNSSSSNNNNSS